MNINWFRLCSIGVMLVGSQFLLYESADAQLTTNSWVSGSDGKWETAGDWSLGIPSINQSAIIITNADNSFGPLVTTKTTTMDTTTGSSAPGSQNISNLFLQGTPGSKGTINQLLMTNDFYALDIYGSLIVSNRGKFWDMQSTVYIESNMVVDGGLVEIDSGTVVANTAGQTSTIIEDGGAVEVTGGQFIAADNDTFDTEILINNGSFLQSGGLVQVYGGNGVTVASGTLTVAGGTNFTLESVQIGSPGTTGTVWITGGELATTETNATPDSIIEVGTYGGVGTLTQSNGMVLTYLEYVGLSYSQGTLTLAGGTNLAQGGMAVGYLGGTGIVWITGGELDTGEFFDNTAQFVGLDLGIDGGGVGTLTQSNGIVRAYQEIVGGGPDCVGTLTVAGGINSFGSGGFAVAPGFNSTGAVWVTGGQLTTTNGTTIIGSLGNATMAISNGTWQGGDVAIATNPGSQGYLTVVGGATANLGEVVIHAGDGGVGYFTVGGSATVSMSGLVLGDCLEDNGFFVVNGGTVYVTNSTHDAVLDVRDGYVELNAGQLVVDRIVITNDCGMFFRNGGTLTVGSLLLDPNLDADGDGLPNGWEIAHGLDPLDSRGVNGAAGDPDGDGFSNLQEYLAGSDPQNPLSTPLNPMAPPFQITSITRSGNNIVLTWNTAGGLTNQVQVTGGGSGGSYSTNGFTNLSPQTIIGGSGITTTNYTDVGGATNKPARFYRVGLVQ